MKRIIVVLTALFFALSLAAQRVLPKPNPQRLVNDAAGLLTPDQIASLEAKLVAYDDSTSNQIVVVTVPSLNGLEPNDYATELGRAWGVGGAQYNNGVVVLISTGAADGEKKKVYISAGYGLEGALPDIILKRIVDAEMIPNLKAGNYYRAVDEATNALIKAAAGEYTAPPGYHERGKGKGLPIGLIVVFIIIALIFLSRRGGGGGDGGGGMMSRRGYRGWNNAPPIIFFPGGGGGGGGGWSGGGGGGGFGGFGGGGFGGGGAGGDW